MDRKDKLKIAAASAVLRYIQGEEEQVVLQARQQMAAPQAPAPVAMNLWGLSGRQSQMHMNGLMLQKAFHGLRFR